MAIHHVGMDIERTLDKDLGWTVGTRLIVTKHVNLGFVRNAGKYQLSDVR